MQPLVKSVAALPPYDVARGHTVYVKDPWLVCCPDRADLGASSGAVCVVNAGLPEPRKVRVTTGGYGSFIPLLGRRFGELSQIDPDRGNRVVMFRQAGCRGLASQVVNLVVGKIKFKVYAAKVRRTHP